jgi:hypothetical protein
MREFLVWDNNNPQAMEFIDAPSMIHAKLIYANLYGLQVTQVTARCVEPVH